jgi:hypothetical protein
MRTPAPSGDSENQDEIGEHQRPSGDKLPPLFIVSLQIEERGHASHDEKKVSR